MSFSRTGAGLCIYHLLAWPNLNFLHISQWIILPTQLYYYYYYYYYYYSLSWRYPSQTITNTDYADDIALLANTPAQVEILLHSLEWAAAGIGLYVNPDKTEYTCFNQRGDISTLKGGPLKLVDKFTYLGSSVSSTETYIKTRLAKAWTATIGYQLYGSQTWPIKKNSGFLSSDRLDTAIWMHYMDAN